MAWQLSVSDIAEAVKYALGSVTVGIAPTPAATQTMAQAIGEHVDKVIKDAFALQAATTPAQTTLEGFDVRDLRELILENAITIKNLNHGAPEGEIKLNVRSFNGSIVASLTSMKVCTTDFCRERHEYRGVWIEGCASKTYVGALASLYGIIESKLKKAEEGAGCRKCRTLIRY